MDTSVGEVPLYQSSWATAVRRGRHVVVAFRRPVDALTTCARNGGWTTRLTHVVNHQSCEGAEHDSRAAHIIGLGPEAYQAEVCGELGLAQEHTAVIGTAAHMQYTAVADQPYDDLTVVALATAGVHGNAGCAGDPARFDERDGKWISLAASGEPLANPAHGTINLCVLIDHPLTPGAFARAVTMLGEGKSAALQALAVGSRSSWRLATGTGTDQFALVAPREGGVRRTWTGHHCKAGELIGATVEKAVLEALRWQNGLEASSTRSLIHAFRRFGMTEESLKVAIEAQLTPAARALFQANRIAVWHEPQSSAAAFSLAAVADRILHGTLGDSASWEALLNQGALLAVGQSARASEWLAFRDALAGRVTAPRDGSPSQVLPALAELVVHAIALGWEAKWRPLYP